MKERLAYFQQYVDHHVMHHEGTPDASTFSEWISNLGFPKLAIFHNDVVMLLVVVLVVGRCVGVVLDCLPGAAEDWQGAERLRPADGKVRHLHPR